MLQWIQTFNKNIKGTMWNNVRFFSALKEAAERGTLSHLIYLFCVPKFFI